MDKTKKSLLLSFEKKIFKNIKRFHGLFIQQKYTGYQVFFGVFCMHLCINQIFLSHLNLES